MSLNALEINTIKGTPRFSSDNCRNFSPVNKISSSFILDFIEVDQIFEDEYSGIRVLPKKLSIHLQGMRKNSNIKKKDICPKASSKKIQQINLSDDEIEIKDTDFDDIPETATCHIKTQNFLLLNKLKQSNKKYQEIQEKYKEKETFEEIIIETKIKKDKNRKKQNCGCLF